MEARCEAAVLAAGERVKGVLGVDRKGFFRRPVFFALFSWRASAGGALLGRPMAGARAAGVVGAKN